MNPVFVAPLLEPILQPAFKYLIQEVDLLIGIEDQVEWIERELRLMQSSLEGVEANRPRVEDEKWAGEAREIFQKVENMIDVYLIKSAQYRRRGIFGRPVFFLNHLKDRFKLSSKKKKIKAQIRDISYRRPIQPEGSHSYQERSSSSLAEPSTSHEPQIPHETATVVASVIGKVNHVMSQNLLVHMGVKKIVRNVGDEFKRLHGILNYSKPDKILDERTRSWIEQVKDTSNHTEEIFASFIEKREQHLTHPGIFQVPFLLQGDLWFGNNLERVRFHIHDLYRRKWTYGIGDLSEIPTSMVSNITKRLSSLTAEAPETVDPLMVVIFASPVAGPLMVVALEVIIIRAFNWFGLSSLFQKRGWLNDQLESIKRDLRIMQGLFKDVDGMQHTEKRVKDWLDEMQDIARDIGEFLRQAEQENVTTTLWKPRSRKRIAQKIEWINDELLGISERKWTYDIGKITGRRSSEVESQSQQEVESSSPNAVRTLLPLAGPSPFPLLKPGKLRVGVDSIGRELKLMCALCDDAKSMDEENARLKVWTKQMQDVYEDARKFIDSYDHKIEQKRVGILRRYHFTELVAPREIYRIQNRIRELSRRKWTYDIGGIQQREGQSNVGMPSTPEANCISVSEPEAHCMPVTETIAHSMPIPEAESHCLPVSEPAQTISSHLMGRRNDFRRFVSSFYMGIVNILRSLSAKPDEQLEENVKSLEEEGSVMHALLEDAGGLERYDGRLKAWVKEIKDVATDVDAAIAAYEETTQQNLLAIPKRGRIAKRIEHIRHKIQDISDRRMRYGISLDKTRKATITMAGNPHQRLAPSVLIKRQDIVSLYDDLQALAALLLTNNEHRSIISIVGMEGIGKTTLAELLYENITVRQHFPCKAWVSVESDCNVEALMKLVKEQVLVSLHEQDEELNAEEARVLEVNRYLIVLDGLSTAEMWDGLIKEFPSTLHGSRIVLTTRDVDVATHADPKSVHKLRLLSDDDSWALFTKTPKTLTVPPELLERSKKMVMRCGGLPGAIIQLREQFQRTESTSGEWLRVLENPNLDQKPWKKTLDMIYGGLPPYLKRCLSYLRRFPVDFDISLRRLIMLWIAEGLVLQRRGDEAPPETVAEMCLAELRDGNMVQVTKTKLNGAVKNCRLPYALREIWSSSEPKISTAGRKIPYLTHLPDGDGVSFDRILGDTTNLSPDSVSPGYKHVISFRSFDTREGIQPGKELGKFLKLCISRWHFLSLHVLDLERVFRPELPEALGELIRLRYLGLRWTYLEFLPSFINKLLNLQTLDVKHTSINTLPTSIWKMEQLRYLYLDESYRCRFVPRPRGFSLTDLQTLWSVFIDEDSPVKDGLDSFIKLKRLGVTSRLMSSREEAMLSQLNAVADWVEKLKLLQSLRLKSFDKQGKPWQLPKMDLTGHTDLSTLYFLGRIAENNLVSRLPEALIELTLSGSGLTDDPMPMLGELPHLRILRLFSESFLGKHMNCPSGGFPQLRILKLWKLEQLEEWEVESGALCDLIDLKIRACQNLKKLPDELRYSRTLQKLDFPDIPGEWENVRNDRFTSNEDELRSQIREKLEECEVENGALSDLIDLEFRSSQKLKKLPDELQDSRTPQMLEFSDMPGDWDKVRNDRFTSNEDELWSQIMEKLVKPTISKSVKIFLFKRVSDELLKGSEKCPFCGAESESAVHLFFLCKLAKMIWFAKWGIRTDYFSNLSIADWISIILTPSLIFGDSPLNETDFLWFAVILMEKTWLWRKRAVTDNVKVDPNTIYEETCSFFLQGLEAEAKVECSPLISFFENQF